MQAVLKAQRLVRPSPVTPPPAPVVVVEPVTIQVKLPPRRPEGWQWKPPGVPTHTIRPVPFNVIATLSCESYDVPVWELYQKTRHPKQVETRDCVVWLARRLTILGYPRIAVAFGKPETAHTSIIEMHRRALARVEADPMTLARWKEIQERCKRLVEVAP